MYFLLTFLLTISPRKSTQSVHQIAQFQSQKCKSSFVWEGGHPLPDPPPARALRALACVFPTILQSYPPLTGIFFLLLPPPPPLTTDTCYAPGLHSFIIVDARKTSLTGVQNSTKKNRLAAAPFYGLHCVSRCQENITYGGSK